MGLHEIRLSEPDEALLYDTIDRIASTGVSPARGLKSDILRTGMRKECNHRLAWLDDKDRG